MSKISSYDFRIVELDGVFKIQRIFTEETKTGMLWWKKVVVTFVWKDITTFGGGCYYLPLLNLGVILDTMQHKMPTFNNIDDAREAIKKLMNPPEPIYHSFKL